jgi:hypothetical protein
VTHTLVAAVCLCLASTAAAADGDVLMPTEVGELYDYLDSFDAPRLAVASQGNFDSVCCFAGCNALCMFTLHFVCDACTRGSVRSRVACIAAGCGGSVVVEMMMITEATTVTVVAVRCWLR